MARGILPLKGGNYKFDVQAAGANEESTAVTKVEKLIHKRETFTHSHIHIHTHTHVLIAFSGSYPVRLA